MSEPTKVWSAGDQANASDLNNDMTEALNDYRDFTLGETIGANIPVYIKASDSKVYKTSSTADNEACNSFVGFLKEAGNANDVKKVQISGKVIGLTGLTVGSKVYLADTAGTYSHTAGTIPKLIGIAVLTTSIILQVGTNVEILVNKDATTTLGASNIKYPTQLAVKTYVDTQLAANVAVGNYTEGDYVIARDERVKSGGGSDPTYTKIREMKVAKAGVVRVYCSWQAGAASGPSGSSIKVYINGSAVSSAASVRYQPYAEFTYDATVAAGDLVQIYGTSGASGTDTKEFMISVATPTVIGYSK